MMIQNEREFLEIFQAFRQVEQGLKLVNNESLNPNLRLDEVEALTVLIAEGNELHAELKNEMDEYDKVHNPDRKGDWIFTYTGKRFWLLDPRPQDIYIVDIAHNLSRINRYNGGTLGKIGYSVAQHSVLASRLVPKEHRMAVLLHDAPEAYIGDVVSPLKKLIGDIYGNIEENIMKAVAEHYGFRYDAEVHALIKYADEVMLATEVRDVVPFGVIRRLPIEKPLSKIINPWEPEVAKQMFIYEFASIFLTIKIENILAGREQCQKNAQPDVATPPDTEKADGFLLPNILEN
jgi:hypothetical protein